MNYIIGLSTMGSSAACLIGDGKIIFAVEEERLSRIKNDSSFPYLSIQACLDFKKININDINEFAIYWNRYDLFVRITQTLKLFSRNIFDLNNFSSLLASIWDKFFGSGRSSKVGSWSDLFILRKLIESKFGSFSGQISFHDHHLCHVISAYAISDKSDSTCLIIDGGGESTSTEQYSIRSGVITKQFSVNWPNSLGHYYSYFTGFLGFKMLEGEYKMMGLSPYGSPQFSDLIENHILKICKNSYIFNSKIASYHSALNGHFSHKIKTLLGQPRLHNEEFSNRHMNIAASVQNVYEKVLLSILKNNHNNDKNLLLAGGCALNVSANGKVIENNIYNKLYIPPCPHDAGAAVGAAILAASNALAIPLSDFIFDSPYLGPIYTNDSIEIELKKSKLNFIKFDSFDELALIVASHLAAGSIVAWFQGRSEFGPRALGNRSLLADPRYEKIRDVINEKVKQRELFRPFAPSCKLEVGTKYFDIHQDSPYMNIAAKVLPEARLLLPAVTHTDGTARVHTVSKSVNEKYWKLIDAFENITGIGVLLNTSFNIQEPIVETPRNAIDCFLNSGIDFLAIDNFLVTR